MPPCDGWSPGSGTPHADPLETSFPYRCRIPRVKKVSQTNREGDSKIHLSAAYTTLVYTTIIYTTPAFVERPPLCITFPAQPCTHPHLPTLLSPSRPTFLS